MTRGAAVCLALAALMGGLSGRSAVAMTLISRGVPAFASTGKASDANDSDYNTYWRSSRLPATLAFDLSSVDPSHRNRILLVWYNDPTYSYDHTLLGAVGYNNPGSYTVEGNAAPGGGNPPVEDWVVLATVKNNTVHSKEHVLNFTGYNWVRMNFTASDGSPRNADVLVNLDIYDVGSGIDDGWLFTGDSITANGMGHTNFQDARSESFGNQVNSIAQITPPQENAGMPGWISAGALPYMPAWLQAFPGKFVAISFGTNDAAGAAPPSVFYTNLSRLLGEVVAAGKTPVVPTIPWSRDPTHAANIPGLNTEIRKLYSKNHCALPGPDLYELFKSHPELISADNVHPTDAGYAELRSSWARTAATIYSAGGRGTCGPIGANH